MLHKNNLKKLLKILSINHYHLVLLFFLYTMTTLQNAIDECQKEFAESLQDYWDFGFENPEEMLDTIEAIINDTLRVWKQWN